MKNFNINFKWKKKTFLWLTFYFNPITWSFAIIVSCIDICFIFNQKSHKIFIVYGNVWFMLSDILENAYFHSISDNNYWPQCSGVVPPKFLTLTSALLSISNLTTLVGPHWIEIRNETLFECINCERISKNWNSTRWYHAI